MQDRFKFRVWDKANKTMHEVFGFSLMNVSFGDSKARSLYHNECILMQCTGLKDKNGKLIFEGDIVRTKEFGKAKDNAIFLDFDIFEVYFSDGAFRIKNKHAGYFNLCISKTIEIIGNIHETPELLEA